MTQPSSRLHVVLVPGFGGFDALGSLEYYAGVTKVFDLWCQEPENASKAVSIHYFDNLPTARVATRAKRLLSYLTKRIARREIMGTDTIALVGHSTGGLDIRRFLLDLHESLDEKRAVDGAKDTAKSIALWELRRRIRRVVFLSVPQAGTNIADFVVAHPVARRALIGLSRSALTAGRVNPVDNAQRCAAAFVRRIHDTSLGRALSDVLSEISTDGTDDDANALADALEAEADVGLYLRHIDFDFAAISDLTALAPAPSKATEATRSPAHFTAAERERELAYYASADERPAIQIRSYATLGARAFDIEDGAPMMSLFDPRVWIGLARKARMPEQDLPYRLAYRACASGPLRITWDLEATLFGGGGTRRVAVSDNDGIVNTASMLWPNGHDTQLVHGDHGDIIGHYDDIPVHRDGGSPPPRRAFHTYDLLGSGPPPLFAPIFKQVWNDVFDFIASNGG